MTILYLVLSAMMMLQSSPAVEQQTSALKARAESGDVKAQVDLGMAYATGDGVSADDAEAAKWFRRAAEKGDPAGEYALSEMYLTGRGIRGTMFFMVQTQTTALILRRK